MTNKIGVRIAYAGPDVDAGTMDVKELAPALLAFGELVEHSVKVLNGPDAKVGVLVKSDFCRGSFEVGMEMIYSISDQVKLLIGSINELSITNIAEIIGVAAGCSQLTGYNLIDLIKTVKNRKIKRAIETSDGLIRLELAESDDGIIVDKNVFSLYRSIPVRQKIDEMLKPLDKPGVESFQVRRRNDGNKEVVAEVCRNDREFFIAPDDTDSHEQEDILDTERIAFYKIIGLQFEEQYKWRLDDGESKIYATIKDPKFLSAIDGGTVSFTKGDTLKVKLRTVQHATTKGIIKTEHEVVEVIKHFRKPEQISLIVEKQNDIE